MYTYNRYRQHTLYRHLIHVSNKCTNTCIQARVMYVKMNVYYAIMMCTLYMYFDAGDNVKINAVPGNSIHVLCSTLLLQRSQVSCIHVNSDSHHCMYMVPTCLCLTLCGKRCPYL